MSDEEWKVILFVIYEVLDKFKQFCVQEGVVIVEDFSVCVIIIVELLEKVSFYEQDCIGVICDCFYCSFEENLGKDCVDENCFEQEVLFYFEKMDINEEKMRLVQYCQYFLEVFNNKSEVKGCKLSFISQEIGCEINILGVKVYFFNIQCLVVGMKDELEKIKE